MSGEVTVRPARGDDDYEHFVGLFPLLAIDDAVPSRERFCDEMAPHSYIAERDGRVVAYAYAHPLDDTGYVRILTVAREAQRTGVGRAVLQHLRERFVSLGLRSFRLNVKPENAPARALYESLGMRATSHAAIVRFPWASLASLPESPAGSLVVREPESSEDESVERAFGVLPGLYASARAQHRVLRVAHQADGLLVGACLFDPTFPGCFSFRARSPEVARALLEALRPHAPAEVPHVQVVVERDEPLAEALVSAGAAVRMRSLHYEAELP